MNLVRSKIIITLLAVFATTSFASAVDVVTRRSDNAQIRGVIEKSDIAQVVVKRTNGEEVVIETSDIKSVLFDGEPTNLRTARSNEGSGSLDLALGKLIDIEKDYSGANKALKADIQFLMARVKAKQALIDAAKADEAIVALQAFRTANKNNFRYLEANLLEVLLHGIKNDAAAGKLLLEEVQQSPVKGYQLQAGVDLGRLLLSAGDAAEAEASFQDVVTKSQGDVGASGALYDGMLGLAMCLKQQSKTDEAIATLDEIIEKAPEGESRTLAEAWLRKGDCLRLKTQPKAALMAYLHVDLLYAGEPAQHAEALKRLSELWTPAGHEDRAVDASARLTQLYPNSQWAKPGSSGG